MQKLDRLVWATGISIHAYGRRIGIRTNAPAVLDRVQELLPPGWEPCFSPLVDHLFSLRVGGAVPGQRRRRVHSLYGGFTLHARSRDLQEVLRALELKRAVCRGIRRQSCLRPRWRGGLARPGAPAAGNQLRGKSTLVAALLRAGAIYYSDDYAVLDPRGFVHPFARRLSIRSTNGTAARCCSPEEFGAQAGTLPLPIGLVAVVQYRPGCCWRPRPLTAGQAVLALLEHTLAAQLDPEGTLRVLQQAVRRARILKGSRGEADATAEQLLAAPDRPDLAVAPVAKSAAVCAGNLA